MRPLLIPLGVAAIWAGAALAASATQPATLGSVTGRVALLDAARSERPSTRSLGTTGFVPGPSRRRAVVYLSSPGGELVAATSPGRATMDQRGERFVPRVLAITVGSSIDFPNSDPTYHNVFSLSRAKSFDLGRYPSGRSKTVRFDRPGIVRVFCDIHSHMSASILVFAHPYFDVASSEGAYRIEGVPPGTYLVNAWMENRRTETRSITIRAGGADTEVDFTLARRDR